MSNSTLSCIVLALSLAGAIYLVRSTVRCWRRQHRILGVVLGILSLLLLVPSALAAVLIGAQVRCLWVGGQWIATPLYRYCIESTSDAGKTCSSGRDCQGYCESIKSDCMPGEAVGGKCSNNTHICDEPAQVEDGKCVISFC
jgi:hypothetical protein